MATRKPFLLRTEPEVLEALQRWAADELRSVNGQIDFLLRRALQRAGRLPARDRDGGAATGSGGGESGSSGGSGIGGESGSSGRSASGGDG